MHNIADISDIAFRIKDNNIALLEKHGNELTTTHQKAIEQIAILALSIGLKKLKLLYCEAVSFSP